MNEKAVVAVRAETVTELTEKIMQLVDTTGEVTLAEIVHTFGNVLYNYGINTGHNEAWEKMQVQRRQQASVWTGIGAGG